MQEPTDRQTGAVEPPRPSLRHTTTNFSALGSSRPLALLTGCCACTPTAAPAFGRPHQGVRRIRRRLTGSQTTWRFWCLLESQKKTKKMQKKLSHCIPSAYKCIKLPRVVAPHLQTPSDALQHQGGSCSPLLLPCPFPTHPPPTMLAIHTDRPTCNYSEKETHPLPEQLHRLATPRPSLVGFRLVGFELRSSKSSR